MESQEQFLIDALHKATRIVTEVDEVYRLAAFPLILKSLINMNDLNGNGDKISIQRHNQNIEVNETVGEYITPNISVNAFFNKAKPESHPARFVCAAYYLLHSGKAEHFTQTDIVETYGKLRIPKPKNTSDVISQCIRKVHIIDGPLSPDKQKTWVITPDGEKFVEELLNDNANSHK